MISPKVSQLVKPGMHGSTFGGGAVIAEASMTMINQTEQVISSDTFRDLINLFSKELEKIKNNSQHVTQTRQMGMMLAIELDVPATDVVKNCLDNGLIINVTQTNIIRLLPPLTTTNQEVKMAFTIITDAIKKCTL